MEEYLRVMKRYSKQKQRGTIKERDDYEECVDEIKEVIQYYQEDYNEAKDESGKQHIMRKFQELTKIFWSDDDIESWLSYIDAFDEE